MYAGLIDESEVGWFFWGGRFYMVLDRGKWGNDLLVIR